MKAVLAQLPSLQVVIPLLGALLAGLLQRGKTAFTLALLVSWLMPVIAIFLLWQVLSSGPISYHLGGWEPPWGIEYRVDALNAFLLLLVSAIGAAIIPFARRSVSFELEDRQEAWFYCMYLLCLTGLLGIVITGDAFNAFVFLEISSLSAYVLIALGPDRRALVAAFRYLIMGTIGATFYVIGIGLLYLVTGTLNMADMAQRLAPAWSSHSAAIIAALAFIVVGISLKLAFYPLHAWLPNAYAYGPSFATAFLSATATKVAIYLLVRFLFSVFGVSLDLRALRVMDIMLVFSVAAMVVPSIVAIFETNIKRMLAYSSIAQIGYITLGIALANQNGLTGGLVHIVNHALMKAALFLAAGAIFFRACPVELSALSGIGRKMPVTMASFTVAGFGLVGTPGTSGFISKWYLALGALDTGSWLLVVLLMVSSLLALVYVGRVLEVIWLREPTSETEHVRDPPLSMLLPLLVLAAGTIYLGIDTRLSAGLASTIAKTLLGGLP